MIIDRTPVTGPRAYLRPASNPAVVNLAAQVPSVARTPALHRGEQHTISGLELLLDASDLRPLFSMQRALDAAAASGAGPQPLFTIRTQKEMFPAFFDDPFRHRVHTVAGFDDFNRGQFENCRAMEIDGVATLVSIGTGRCVWTSRVYDLPRTAAFAAGCWELATSRLTPKDSFQYGLKLRWWAPGATPSSGSPQERDLAGAASTPDLARAVRRTDLTSIAAFQLVFSAEVFNDSYVLERHAPVVGQSIGRPLLRAVNLIEPVDSLYRFFTLQELLGQCSSFDAQLHPGPAMTRLRAMLDLSATLTFSERQQTAASSNDYEFIELQLETTAFSSFEARVRGEESLRLTPA